jgi:hypothetical protein
MGTWQQGDIMMRRVLIAVAMAGFLACGSGCMGRTGKVGAPIAEAYKDELTSLRVGQSTPDDLKKTFSEKRVSLKESKTENGRVIEIWEVFKGGNVDAAQFVLWGQIAHDKDQSLLFRFENGRLASYESYIHPDK